MNDESRKTRVERFIEWIQDHKLLSVFVIIGIVVVALSKFITSTADILRVFQTHEDLHYIPQVNRRDEMPFGSVFREPLLPFTAEFYGFQDVGVGVPVASFRMEVGKEKRKAGLIENEIYSFTSHNTIYAFSWTYTTWDKTVPARERSQPGKYVTVWLRNAEKK